MVNRLNGIIGICHSRKLRAASRHPLRRQRLRRDGKCERTAIRSRKAVSSLRSSLRCALPRQAATTVQNPRGSATLRLCVKGFFPLPRTRLAEGMQNFASGEAKFCHQELGETTFASDRTFEDCSNPARTDWWSECRSTANSSCRLAVETRPGPSRTAPGRFRTTGVAGSCLE